jgi:hypothetical protein
VDNLMSAVADGPTGPVAVAIALRADFYAHCAQFAGLRQMLGRTQVYIGPMDRDELRRTVEGPAQHGGWTLEPGLADMILDDVGDEPGALPLLSHALLETWRRRGQMLPWPAVEWQGARHVAKTAETTFQNLMKSSRYRRRIFC